MYAMENKVKFKHICTNRLSELLFLLMTLVTINEYLSIQNQIFLLAEYFRNLNETKGTCWFRQEKNERHDDKGEQWNED